MKISIIAAIGNNGELGVDNRLLWNIPKDLKNFKRLTSGHHIIMGRKTFDSIGFVLPNRISLVLTRSDASYTTDNVRPFKELNSAITYAKESGETELFIIGGAEIYSLAFCCGVVDRIHLSRIDYSGEADAFFPNFDTTQYTRVFVKEYPAYDSSPCWRYEILENHI